MSRYGERTLPDSRRPEHGAKDGGRNRAHPASRYEAWAFQQFASPREAAFSWSVTNGAVPVRATAARLNLPRDPPKCTAKLRRTKKR